MVVPVGAVVKMIVTSNDVIHAWGVPAFWTKIDAVPGRLNETWFRADRPGVYYGVCYELCGARHGYMPIAVEVVTAERFAAWVASKDGHMPGAGPAAARAAGPGAAAVSATEGTASAAGFDQHRRGDRSTGRHEPGRDQIRRQRNDDRHHRKCRPFRGRPRRITTRITMPITSRASSPAGSCRRTTRTSARSI